VTVWSVYRQSTYELIDVTERREEKLVWLRPNLYGSDRGKERKKETLRVFLCHYGVVIYAKVVQMFKDVRVIDRQIDDQILVLSTEGQGPS